MPGDNFGDGNFLWGTALLNAVTAYILTIVSAPWPDL